MSAEVLAGPVVDHRDDGVQDTSESDTPGATCHCTQLRQEHSGQVALRAPSYFLGDIGEFG